MRIIRNWVALYSYSGGELKTICNKMNIQPELTITNGKNTIFDTCIFQVNRKLTSDDYNTWFYGKRTLITLHGWNRIIPADICKQYYILNVHPGLVSKYPELKGADPQKKAFELGLKTSGVTIHQATEELDGGPIIIEKEVSIVECKNEGDVVSLLRNVSIDLWQEVLTKSLTLLKQPLT